MTKEQQYQLLQNGGAPLSSLATFRRVNNLPEDPWLTAALAADARDKAPAPSDGVRIEPVARVAARPAKSNRRTGRQRRTVDPTKLYYSDLGGEL